MKLFFSFFVSFYTFLGLGLSQTPPATEEQYDKKYNARINQEKIYGVYIPKDLADAFAQLNKLIDKNSRKKFAEVPEDVAVKKLHFSLGRWIIYNWGFYEGSRLSHYLKKMGIYHPDDMARFIIISYHRYCNKKDLDVKKLVEEFKAKQEQEKVDRKNKGKVIHEEKKQRTKD